jgi:hypothetical protein
MDDQREIQQTAVALHKWWLNWQLPDNAGSSSEMHPVKIARNPLFWIPMAFLLRASCLVSIFLSFAQSAFASPSITSLQDALDSKQDVWGLAAMRQTNGPTYDFFAKMLPPLRYVNAAFHYYPITLSAPGSRIKARLVSNGSAVNARANLSTWKEVGIPFQFSVGEPAVPYGRDVDNLPEPQLANGYLPIVRLNYRHGNATYEEEAFASVTPPLAALGMVFVNFRLSHGDSGLVQATLATTNTIFATNGMLLDSKGQYLAWFNAAWKWNPTNRTLAAILKNHSQACLGIPATPFVTNEPAALNYAGANLSKRLLEERKQAIRTWQDLLDGGAQIETPEPVVNNAWRALVIGNYSMLKSNSMNYSVGNAYDRLYQAECGDATRALALYGHSQDAARMIHPLLDYTRDGLVFHNAGFKLQTLAHYYWLTRDSNFIYSAHDKWSREVQRIIEGREKDSGLFPRERYCGDIATKVYSLHSNGASWRGLRDFAAVMEDIGNKIEAAPLIRAASELRAAMLTATDKSEFTNTSPPFIPVALYGEEKPCDNLTSSMLCSYWNLIAPYMLGSEMFGNGSARERSIIDYIQEHGGVFMGMIRFNQHSGLYANGEAVDDLYGLRYTIKLLELDEPDRALVSFYGKLAQGLTRNTFVGAEGTGLRPEDSHGRPMYLPPNSAGNAFFLWTLRYLMVQDWDLDGDGVPETLRIGFATPREWLKDGKSFSFRALPTAFGPISGSFKSDLGRRKVTVTLSLPTRQHPAKTLLRVRLPDGWKVQTARNAGQKLSLATAETFDISSFSGEVTFDCEVVR